MEGLPYIILLVEKKFRDLPLCRARSKHERGGERKVAGPFEKRSEDGMIPGWNVCRPRGQDGRKHGSLEPLPPDNVLKEGKVLSVLKTPLDLSEVRTYVMADDSDSSWDSNPPPPAPVPPPEPLPRGAGGRAKKARSAKAETNRSGSFSK